MCIYIYIYIYTHTDTYVAVNIVVVSNMYMLMNELMDKSNQLIDPNTFDMFEQIEQRLNCEYRSGIRGDMI